jgi:hypothetical protein
MKLSVIFDATGDEIEFNVLAPVVAETYVNWINNTNINKFFINPRKSAECISEDQMMQLDSNYNKIITHNTINGGFNGQTI